MATTNSLQNSKSRYVLGGTTYSVNSDMIGWWDMTTFTKSTSDVTMVLTKKYEFRPDLVAYEAYGTPTLMWLVLQYNCILDIATEFVAGATITLPSADRVMMQFMG